MIHDSTFTCILVSCHPVASAFYRQLEPVSKQLTIVIGLTVVGFMAFGLAVSFYRNTLFEDDLKKMAEENRLLAGRVEASRWDLEYYRSSQYVDKYAKENFNRLRPGEKLLLIEQSPAPLPGSSAEETVQDQAALEEYLRSLPILEHWKLYLFGRDRLEQLKKGLRDANV